MLRHVLSVVIPAVCEARAATTTARSVPKLAAAAIDDWTPCRMGLHRRRVLPSIQEQLPDPHVHVDAGGVGILDSDMILRHHQHALIL